MKEFERMQMMKTSILTFTITVIMGVCSITHAQGTIDFDNAVTVKKDGTGDFTTIQAAVSSKLIGSGSEVIVFPGVYVENISIDGTDNVNRSVFELTLRSYDGPNFTLIDGSNRRMGDEIQNNTLEIDHKKLTLIGFTITGGLNGILTDSTYLSTLTVSNCVFFSNDANGILLQVDGRDDVNVEISNNVFHSNRESGLKLNEESTSSFFRPVPVGIFDNVFYRNENFGIDAVTTPSIYISGATSDIRIRYNNLYENGDGPYSEFIQSNFETNEGNLSLDPFFVGPSSVLTGFDFRLRPDSSLRNQGNPAVIYNDPDGTRNDMGAYGGSLSTNFFESINDGPVVRDIRISPSAIFKNGTFTIEAIGSVR